MQATIERRLAELLKPLLNVPLIINGETAPEQKPYAELSTLSVTALGMSDELITGMTESGEQIVRGQRKAEIGVNYYGSSAVAQLSTLVDKLRMGSVSELFQLAQIGIGSIETVKASDTDKKLETPMSDAQLRFDIHYSILINDAVGIIETIDAAYAGSNIHINLMR